MGWVLRSLAWMSRRSCDHDQVLGVGRIIQRNPKLVNELAPCCWPHPMAAGVVKRLCSVGRL